MAEARWRRATRRSPASAALALGLLLWTGVCEVLPAARQDPPSLAHATATLAAGDAAGAEREFRRLLLEDPDGLEALLGWARSLAAQGRGPEAVSPMLQAAERRLAAGSHGQAVRLLELAAALDPGSARTRARLGRALILDRRFLAAEAPLRQALARGGRNPDWLLDLGAVLWEKGELDEAERLHREAVERASGRGRAASRVTWRQLGRLLLWRGRYAEAAAALDNARALGAVGFEAELDRARALEGWARALASTGEGDAEGVLRRALEAFQGAVGQAPEHSGARYGLARVLAELGEAEQAADQLAIYRELYREDQARTRDKGLARAGLDSARDLLGSGRAQEAAEVLAGLPETADMLATLALAQRELGRPQAARRSLERALLLEPRRSDLQALLAELAAPPPE